MKKQEIVELKNIFNELRRGNKKVIEDLYQKYNKMIYGIAFSILKNREDSEDIVQIVFSKLYTIEQGKLPKDKEATWVYTVTKNETLLFLRKKNNTYDIEKVYNLEDENNEINKLIDRESYNQLINELNDKEKEVVSLKIISNLSFSQISELLGEPIGTVKWRYYKSIYALRIMLSNFGMFVVTFILGIATFKQTKKTANEEMKQEISDNVTESEEDISDSLREDIEMDKTENTETDDIEKDEQMQENIVVQEPTTQHDLNYLGYGIMGVSAVFLILTIIFAIILKKYQLNSIKKSSK